MIARISSRDDDNKNGRARSCAFPTDDVSWFVRAPSKSNRPIIVQFAIVFDRGNNICGAIASYPSDNNVRLREIISPDIPFRKACRRRRRHRIKYSMLSDLESDFGFFS